MTDLLHVMVDCPECGENFETIYEGELTCHDCDAINEGAKGDAQLGEEIECPECGEIFTLQKVVFTCQSCQGEELVEVDGEP